MTPCSAKKSFDKWICEDEQLVPTETSLASQGRGVNPLQETISISNQEGKHLTLDTKAAPSSGSIASNLKGRIQESNPGLLERSPRSNREPHIPLAGTPKVQESNSVHVPANALDTPSMPSPSLESSGHVQPQNQSWKKHLGGIGFRVRRENG